jgi:long-chain fatty acid transport protein
MSKTIKLAGLATVSIIALTSAASAGGFAIREQSAIGLGNSYAGAAAGGSGLSSMFWNPATLTQNPGLQATIIGSGILPYGKVTPSSASNTTVTNGGGTAGDAQLGLDAFVPAGYASWQFTKDMWVGLSLNAPFGLGTRAPVNWTGALFNRTSQIKTYDTTVSLGYEVNDKVSLGFGLQLAQVKVRMNNARISLQTNADTSELSGDAFAAGFTLGATFKPWQGGEIGVGYRSRRTPMLQGVQERYTTAGALVTSYDIQSSIRLPDSVNVGIRQQLTSDFTALAGFEWTHWSVWSQFPVYVRNGSSATPTTLVFNYHDGWFASVGGEYKWNKDTTVRFGLGYERAPIQDDNRSNRIPDGNRIWTSLGASYQWNDSLSIDAAYAHLFVKSGVINQSGTYYAPGATTFNFSGDVKAHTDIVSVGLTYKFGAEPKKATNKALITK